MDKEYAGQAYRGTSGCEARAPDSNYKLAAMEWAACRDRLEHARAKHAQAEAELREAAEHEQKAWINLTGAAGRDSPPPSAKQAY